MKLEAKHVWLLSLPCLAAASFLPVTQDAWLDGPTAAGMNGLTAAFWILLSFMGQIQLTIAAPSFAFPEHLLGILWGLFLPALAVTPILIFTRWRENQPAGFFAAAGFIVVVLVGSWFSPLLRTFDSDPRPFRYSGYLVLAVAIAFTVIALVLRGIRPHPEPAAAQQS